SRRLYPRSVTGAAPRATGRVLSFRTKWSARALLARRLRARMRDRFGPLWCDMKIVILGAGALGSIVGAHLRRAGHDVTLIARGDRAKVLAEHGIRLTGLAELTTPVAVTTEPKDVRKADVLIVTVKTYDTDAALASVHHVDVPTVLSIQNGVLKNEQLGHVFGRERVVGAAVIVAGEVLADGVVRFTMNERFSVGELPEGTSPRVTELASALTRAGLRAEASTKIQTVEWSKYLLFVSGMAVAALTRLPTGKFLSDTEGATIVVQIIQDLRRLAA